MDQRKRTRRKRSERGISLFLVALGLIVLLAVAGLSVDLATLYVARNEAQRAADSAALAGAQVFAQSDVSEGLMTPTQAESLAATNATSAGNQNMIIGRNPNLSPTNFADECPPPTGVSGGCFDFSIQNDPRITVVVRKNMPTYFMRAFGVRTVPVSVTATAEAYTPQGNVGPTSSVQCVKPWLLPNCDYDHPDLNNTSGVAGPKDNSYCPYGTGSFYEYFVYPPTSSNAGQIVNQGLKPDGIVGEQLTIKAGNPKSNDVSAPSKFWPVFLPTNGTFTCPNCASADQQNSTSNSAALYRENIECCSTQTITCGYNTVDPISGDMTGPTGQGVDCLIHENNQGTGQDTVSFATSDSVPYTMYSGSLNPYTQPAGTVITTSDSIVTLPLYDGEILCPGNSCPSTVSVDVTGFLELFIEQEGPPNSTVTAYVLSVSSCSGGDTQNGGGGPVVVPATAGTPITVRLIHN